MITPINNVNTNLTFKRLDIVQIPKKVFENVDYRTAERQAEVVLISRLPFKQMVKAVLAKYFDKVDQCYEMFIESPAYAELMDMLKSEGSYSIEWLRAHTGEHVDEPMRDDAHSFFIVTGKDLDVFRNGLDAVSLVLKPMLRKLFQKHYAETGIMPDALWTKAVSNNLLTKCFKVAMKDVNPVVFEVNDLDEFGHLVQDIFTSKTM